MDAGPGPVIRPVARTGARRGRAVLIVPVAATVAVVLVAGCAATPAATPGAASSTRPSMPAHPSAEVPWAALAPTYPTIPRHTTPAVPDPAEAEAAPPCRASDLRASSELDGATGGTWVLSVHLRSTGSRCRLAGHPTVTLLDDNRPLGVPTVPARGRRNPWNYQAPVLVGPGASVLVTLTWGKEWCTAPMPVDRVRLDLPGGAGGFTVRGFRRTPSCTVKLADVAPADRHGSPVVVGSFAPQRWRPATVESAWASTRAALRGTTYARPGHPLDFEVVLTPRRDVSLEPCPDFTIEQYLAHRRSREDRFALNCAAVPTRDAHGRPYLPAGRPVRFAMHVDLLAAHAVKFVWTLDVPEHVGDGRALVAAR